ncbi:hypothetical protein E2562_028725, partial [Oryza meyeriana var. granulata]
SGDLLDEGDGKLVVGVLLMISGGDRDLLDGDVLDAVFSIASGGVDLILRRRRTTTWCGGEGDGRSCLPAEAGDFGSIARYKGGYEVLYYIDAEDSSYAFYEDDLSNDQEQDDTLDKVPTTGSGPTLGTACCIPF